jgi:hypothetical protein
MSVRFALIKGQAFTSPIRTSGLRQRVTPFSIVWCMSPRQMRNSNLCLYEKAKFCVLFMKLRRIVAFFVTTGYAVYGCWFIMETSAKVQYT